jgi:choline dehydrogenase-like flavoprotein
LDRSGRQQQDGLHGYGASFLHDADGRDPATSVVDANAMVHGVNGLFVAGSSVFPTGGHANPTLMLLALAIRLADHLKVRFASEIRLRASLPDAEAKTTHQ